MPIESLDFDAMPARQLVSRWVITGNLRLVTAAHVGGTSTSSVDMAILRCPATGRPLLPGTSLAGALRGYALDRLVGYGAENHVKRITGLFGGYQGDDDGAQSPLIVFDALANEATIEIRDGVMLDPERGTAVDKKKFDFELLPAGTIFPVRFDLMVGLGAPESELLSFLALCLDGLSKGELSLGMRRSRGLGQLACEGWRARRFDLTSPHGWLEWASADHDSPIATGPDGYSSAREALQEIHVELAEESTADSRERIVINLELELDGELLIRSSSTEPSAPDVGHLQSGGRPVVSGTSLTGALRAHALRIVQLVHELQREEAEARWVEVLFGPRLEGDRDPNFRPWGSRLRVAERFVNGGDPRRAHRIAIDRFTQGVVPGALFDEEAQAGGNLALRFEIRSPQPGEAGLLLLLLRDLATGRLPVGGASSVGRGTLRGRALTLEGAGVSKPVSVSLNGNQMAEHPILEAMVGDFVTTKRSSS